MYSPIQRNKEQLKNTWFLTLFYINSLSIFFFSLLPFSFIIFCLLTPAEDCWKCLRLIFLVFHCISRWVHFSRAALLSYIITKVLDSAFYRPLYFIIFLTTVESAKVEIKDPLMFTYHFCDGYSCSCFLEWCFIFFIIKKIKNLKSKQLQIKLRLFQCQWKTICQ